MSHPRHEAEARLDHRYEARVLEPSPPAVHEEPWFADDPAVRGDVPPGRTVVSPVTSGDLLWDELAAEDEALAAWCAERWLASYRRLGPAPAGLVETRRALHRLAEHVISPTRQRANGKIGLRYTRGGFGTPFFGSDAQIRVEGDTLVLQLEGEEHTGRITSIKDAAEFIGIELTRFDAALDDERLALDAAASAFLGDWFGFAASVLEELRAEARPEDEPARVQLWPEHFDMALEIGAEDAEARAACGCSPGDEDQPEPYLYVAPWAGAPRGSGWDATSFTGAELPYGELVVAEHQRGTAMRFFRERLSMLAP